MAQRLNQESLSCSICLEILKEPVTLPCGHSFCRHCIQSSWSRAVTHSCPQCRQSFTPRPVLSKNTLLANLVEELKASGLIAPPAELGYAAAGDVSCDVCSGRKLKAVSSCLNCLVSFCDEHLQPHRDVAVLQRHQLVAPSHNLQEHLCSEHHELKKFFCRTDQQLICSLCSVDQHKGHDTVASAAERTDRQKHLQTKRSRLIQELQDKQSQLKQAAQRSKAVGRSARAAVQRSEASFREMILLLEKRRSEVEQQIYSEEQSQLKQVQELQERLQQDISALKKNICELDTLSLTADHNQFILLCPSLSTLTEETRTRTRTQTTPRRDFEDLTRAVSALRDKLQLSLGESNMAEPAPTETENSLINAGEPREGFREDFLRYACDITLDEMTAHLRLSLSEEDRKITVMAEDQRFPEYPDSFKFHHQVLSSQFLTGRCYWEVELSGRHGVSVAVSYWDIERQGARSLFGNNNKSWALYCDRNRHSFQFNGSSFDVSATPSERIGVYMDHSAGTLCFYSVHCETMNLIHKVQANFTQPLFAGIRFHGHGLLGLFSSVGDSAHFLKL